MHVIGSLRRLVLDLLGAASAALGRTVDCFVFRFALDLFRSASATLGCRCCNIGVLVDFDLGRLGSLLLLGLSFVQGIAIVFCLDLFRSAPATLGRRCWCCSLCILVDFDLGRLASLLFFGLGFDRGIAIVLGLDLFRSTSTSFRLLDVVGLVGTAPPFTWRVCTFVIFLLLCLFGLTVFALLTRRAIG